MFSRLRIVVDRHDPTCVARDGRCSHADDGFVNRMKSWHVDIVGTVVYNTGNKYMINRLTWIWLVAVGWDRLGLARTG